MVNDSVVNQNYNASTEVEVASDSCSMNGTADNEKKGDCHNVVKSSGLGCKKRVCCDHQRYQQHKHSDVKPKAISVSCQTDIDVDMATFQAVLNGQPSGASSSANDGSPSEGLLRLMIHNFRNMNNTVRGPAKVVSSVPWKIMVMPRQHVVAKKGTQKCLGFFLQCCPESYSDSWSCQAAAELRLISQKQGIPNFVRKTNHVYTAKENDWGYSCFMTWADILDENQGYMKDEKVILEVYVKADQPKGILTYDAFCKKIQDYMRLADLQSSRGLIDKALEVNQSAVKFCKEKDNAMKADLEKQKAKLIEMKLKQSIERIEKGASLKQTVDPATGALVPEGPRKEIDLKTAAARLSNAAKAAKLAAKTTTGSSTGGSTNRMAVENNANANNKTGGYEKEATGRDSLVPPDGQEEPSIDEDDDGASTSDNEGQGGMMEDRHDARFDDFELGSLDALSESCESCDDDEPYVCDSCLEDRLDSSVNENEISIGEETKTKPESLSERSCQTEFANDADKSLAFLRIKESRGLVVPASVNAKQPLVAETARVVLSSDSTDVINVSPPPSAKNSAPSTPLPQPHPDVVKADAQPPIHEQQSNNCKTTMQTTQQQPKGLIDEGEIQVVRREIKGIGEQITASAVKKFNLSEENEQKLLKMITEESKHSLNSIRDTLERLVSMADGNLSQTLKQGGLGGLGALVPPPNSVGSVPVATADINIVAVAGRPMANPGQKHQQNDTIEPPPAVPVDMSTTQNKAQLVQQPTQRCTHVGVLSTPPPPQDPKPDSKKICQALLKQQQNQLAAAVTAGGGGLLQPDKAHLLQELREHDSKLLSMMIANAGGMLDPVLRQQSVQTDMSSFGSVGADLLRPNSPSLLSEDPYRLLAAQAQELADAKPEELLSKYSSLIEQSEANRLAETVKKVEKRMKDIEKQTMTCRKELSDECERHYKEEQKLNKQLKQLQQQLHQANERAEKLNTQLKDKRQEVKKLEKRLKQESQACAEATELQAKVEALEKELQANQKRHNEECKRLQKENQKLTENRDLLQQELSYATSEIERLNQQLEEKSLTLKKLENNTEKWKSKESVNQGTLKEATERAKKAEVNLLEFKLEMGIASCQRALRDCEHQSQQSEDVYRRLVKSGQNGEATKRWGMHLDDWNRYRERTKEIMTKAKTDFNQQIDQIKAGRPLASLPPLEFPVLPMPPPAPPKVPSPPPQSPVSSNDGKKIAPIGVNPSKQQQTSPQSLSHAASRVAATGVAVSVNPSGTDPPQQSAPPPHQHLVYPQSPAPPQPSQFCATPTALKLDTSVPPPPLPSGAVVGTPTGPQQGMPPMAQPGSLGTEHWAAAQHMQQQHGGVGVAGGHFPPTCSVNSFSPWNDSLSQQLTQTLFGGKSLNSIYEPGPLACAAGGMGGASMGWNSWGSNQLNLAAAGVSGGDAGLGPSPIGSAWNPMQQQQAGQMHSMSGLNMQVVEGRTESPVISDKVRQMVGALLERLQMSFPKLCNEKLIEAVEEYRVSQGGKVFKQQTLEQMVQGVRNLILSKQHKQMVDGNGGWLGNPGATSQGQSSGPQAGVGSGSLNGPVTPLSKDKIEQCGLCSDLLHKQKQCVLACKHKFHVKCAKEWLSHQDICPTCRSYVPPVDDFPDLA